MGSNAQNSKQKQPKKSDYNASSRCVKTTQLWNMSTSVTNYSQHSRPRTLALTGMATMEEAEPLHLKADI